MKNLFFLSLGLFLFTTACEVDPDIDIIRTTTVDLISPDHVDALSDVLIMPQGAVKLDGPVYPTSNGDEPTITSPEYFVLSANGATTPIQLTYSHALPRLGGFYVQVKGASSYYKIPYKGQPSAAGEITIPIGIPSIVDQGEFCISFYVYDVANEVSEATITCISVIR